MSDKIIVNSSQTSFLSDELRQLLMSLGTSRKIKQNTFLFQEEMHAEEIYLIKSGLIQINMMSTDGKGITLRICKEGDLLGETTLYTDNPKYLLNARVIESGEVICVNIEQLQEELENNHLLATELIKWYCNHVRKLQLKMNDLLLNGKKGALYSALIRLANSCGVKREDGILISIAFKDQELADLCGATREYTNRLLTELREKNILLIDSTGKMLVKNLNYLKRKINCRDCSVSVCNIN